MPKDLLEGFYLYSPVNNTFVQVDSRGNRIAADKITQAKRFDTEKDVNNYIEMMCLEGHDFLNFYKVIKGIEFKDDFINTTAWPHYSLVQFKDVCKKMGVVNESYFRGRLAHVISLMKNQDEDEFAYEMIGVRNDDQETSYP